MHTRTPSAPPTHVRPRIARPPRRWCPCGLAPLLVVLFVGFDAGAVASTTAAGFQDRAAATARLEEATVLLESLRATLDRSAFDLDALATALAPEDPGGIAAWVEREIAYEPYDGLLRGPGGTLRARSGNALDQAVLLARLFDDQGYEARVLLGRLDDDQVDALLRRASRPRPPPPTLGDLDGIAEAWVRLAALADRPAPERAVDDGAGALAGVAIDPDLANELVERHSEIVGALNAAGVVLGAGAERVLRDEARRYAWVEARVGPDDPWLAYHPTGAEPGLALVATGVLDEATAVALQHRIRIEAWIERLAEGRLERVPIMRPFERPVAAVAGVVLDYTNVPDGLERVPSGPIDVDAVLTRTTAFAPFFMGQLPPDALAFDLEGATWPAGEVRDGAAPVSALVDRAASAFGRLDAAPPAPAADRPRLLGQGIDVTLIAPGGAETSFRRWSVDHRDAGEAALADDAVETGHALLRHDRIVVVTGALPAGYLFDAAIEGLLGVLDLVAFAVEMVADPAGAVALERGLVPDESPAGQLLLADLFDVALGAAPAGYRSGPTVLAFGRSLEPDGLVRHYVDIVANARRVLSVQADGSPGIAAEDVVRRGVWETLAEREVVRDAGATLRASIADARAPFAVLWPEDVGLIDALDLPASAAHHLRADLERGFVALLPTERADGVAWWRVDPATGTTLGVTADGRGQAASEYVAEQISAWDYATAAMLLIKSFYDCGDIADPSSQFCCMVKTVVNGAIGYGLGKGFGFVAGISASSAVVAASMGMVFSAITSVPGAFDPAGGIGLTCP